MLPIRDNLRVSEAAKFLNMIDLKNLFQSQNPRFHVRLAVGQVAKIFLL